MRIDKASVDHFGKIKQCELEFKEGINIIYGENESGKSTLLAFIKTMLYGFTSNKKNIRDNDRKRYMQWGEIKACGEIYLDDGQVTYRVKRSFGERKSQDKIELMNAVSGENIQLDALSSPGKLLLGIEAHTYEKTSLITQLSSKINQNNSDEVIKYLTNLKGTGDASVSYHKAKKDLEDYRKSFVNTNKKPGVLDDLKKDYDMELEKLSQLKNKKNIFEKQVLKDIVDIDRALENLFSIGEFNKQAEIENVKTKVIQYKDIRLENQSYKKEDDTSKLHGDDTSEILSMDSIQAQEDLNKIIEESVRIQNYYENIKKYHAILDELNELYEEGKGQALAQEIKKTEYAAEEIEGLFKKQQDINDQLKDTFKESELRKTINKKTLMIGTAFICLLLMAAAIIAEEIPAPAGAVMILPFFYLLSRVSKVNQKSHKTKLEKQKLQHEMIRLEKRIKANFDKYQVKNFIQLYEKIQKMKIEYGKIDTVIKEREKLLDNFHKDRYTNLIERSEVLISQLLKKYKCENREDLQAKIQKHQDLKEQLSRLDEIEQLHKREEREIDIKKQTLYQEILEEISMLYEQFISFTQLNIDSLKEKIMAYKKEVEAVDEALNAIENAFVK
ncbi:MAG: AAA family ATPase, partial [Clostridia bacterium]|nr:AAA family ATPase [Clostridia bacterium]